MNKAICCTPTVKQVEKSYEESNCNTINEYTDIIGLTASRFIEN